jgi:signal transduction histidine kinase
LGDFLQKVYASVAILENRLPPDWRTEREVLTRLHERTEACRKLLDNVQDFLCPVTLSPQPVDLAMLAGQLMEDFRPRFPHLRLTAQADQAVWISVDPDRVVQIGEILLTNACDAARSLVTFTTSNDPVSANVHWSISDDGPGISPELTAKLFRPFCGTRPGHMGLGLALAQKLVLLHGGSISVANQSQGGCRSEVWIPSSPG